MGTPDFAVPCLERIISDGHTVSAVFTRADKPVGRKHIMTPPPVKVTALENNIAVFQPERLRNNEEVLNILKEISPDVIVVVAYGRILPNEILNLPKYGCVNVHGSLLPRHRGASPIQWSIVCGDKKTGVTTMYMDDGIDTGDILETAEIDILPDDTGESLHDKLSVLGANLLSSTLKKIENGTVKPQKQLDAQSNYAPILTKEMGEIDFSLSSKEIDCLIRGLTPWPLAYFSVDGRKYKVYNAVISEKTDKAPGTVCYKNSKMLVACGDSTFLEIREICPDGSKRMNSTAFINGRFLAENTVIVKG